MKAILVYVIAMIVVIAIGINEYNDKEKTSRTSILECRNNMIYDTNLHLCLTEDEYTTLYFDF